MWGESEKWNIPTTPGLEQILFNRTRSTPESIFFALSVKFKRTKHSLCLFNAPKLQIGHADWYSSCFVPSKSLRNRLPLYYLWPHLEHCMQVYLPSILAPPPSHLYQPTMKMFLLSPWISYFMLIITYNFTTTNCSHRLKKFAPIGSLLALTQGFFVCGIHRAMRKQSPNEQCPSPEAKQRHRRKHCFVEFNGLRFHWE